MPGQGQFSRSARKVYSKCDQFLVSEISHSLCCVTGYECLDKASSPVACQAGEYSLSASSSGCQTCPAGSSCPSTDASPIPCATGRCWNSLQNEQKSECVVFFFLSVQQFVKV